MERKERQPVGERNFVSPQIIYEPGVNETTPYIVLFNGQLLGQLLREKFGMNEHQIKRIKIFVSSEKKETEEDIIIAEVYTEGIISPKSSIKFYIGSLWTELEDLKTRRRKVRALKVTKQDLIRNIFHESQHVKDELLVRKRHLSVSGIFLMGALASVLSLLNSENSKIYLPITFIAFGVGYYYLWRGKELGIGIFRDKTKIASERRAVEIEHSVPTHKWMDLVEFGPNPNYYLLMDEK